MFWYLSAGSISTIIPKGTLVPHFLTKLVVFSIEVTTAPAVFAKNNVAPLAVASYKVVFQ